MENLKSSTSGFDAACIIVLFFTGGSFKKIYIFMVSCSNQELRT